MLLAATRCGPGPPVREPPPGFGTPVSRRPAGRGGDLLPQGVHPGHPAVPGPLPLLHVRRPRRGSSSGTGRRRSSPPTRSSTSPRRARSWAARRRCSPWATGPRTGGPRPENGCTSRATTRRWPTSGRWPSGCSRRPGCCRTSTRAYVVGGAEPAQAGRAVDGDDARDHLAPAVREEGRGALRLAGQGPGGPAAGARGRRPASIPFTTGLLVGIGETLTERAETIFAIRAVARRTAHVQEVIVQNFRAKPDTAMRHVDDLGLDDYLAAIAVTRLVLGPKVRVQAPPNLVDLAECRALLGAGIDDWGGVSPLTPDHVNPERPWPSLERLRRVTAACGSSCAPGSPSTPSTSRPGEPWLDPRVSAHVAALADERRPGRARRPPDGLPWQEPDGGFAWRLGRTDLHTAIDTDGPHRRSPGRLRPGLRGLDVVEVAAAVVRAAGGVHLEVEVGAAVTGAGVGEAAVGFLPGLAAGSYAGAREAVLAGERGERGRSRGGRSTCRDGARTRGARSDAPAGRSRARQSRGRQSRYGQGRSGLRGRR